MILRRVIEHFRRAGFIPPADSQRAASLVAKKGGGSRPALRFGGGDHDPPPRHRTCEGSKVDRGFFHLEEGDDRENRAVQ